LLFKTSSKKARIGNSNNWQLFVSRNTPTFMLGIGEHNHLLPIVVIFK